MVHSRSYTFNMYKEMPESINSSISNPSNKYQNVSSNKYQNLRLRSNSKSSDVLNGTPSSARSKRYKGRESNSNEKSADINLNEEENDDDVDIEGVESGSEKNHVHIAKNDISSAISKDNIIESDEEEQIIEQNDENMETEPDPVSKKSDLEGTSDSEDEDYVVDQTDLRRSSRQRKLKFNYLNASWILGGGGISRGYPNLRNSANVENENEMNEQSTQQEEDDDDQEDSYEEENNKRETRSTRTKKVESSTGSEEDEEGDLYTRIKKYGRRSGQTINYDERRNLNKYLPDSKRTLRSGRGRKRLANNDGPSQSRRRSPQGQIEKYLMKARKRRVFKRKRSSHHSGSSNSSHSHSSSDESDNSQLVIKRSSKNKIGFRLSNSSSEKEKAKSRIEIQPLSVDKSISFESVGGLELQIQKLKEMVIFPLLYKEFFQNRGVDPPRGVLFHGPPGTGKTLIARALAAEASCVGGREVAFFLRKGADVLNKWIGESERHLKLLFEQAILKQPSIIFFDEIDGLAPMRSSKTDQIHNSIVSTLLAELDGLKDRGQVIVIGATNRVDNLDPALRRPGRFDIEFQFMLPSLQARKDIFNINLKSWTQKPSDELVDDLSTITTGYSGADIKLLCAEASLGALKRRYPQIYKSNQKFVLDYDSIKVERNDWINAMSVVGRSTERSIYSTAFTPLPLPPVLSPLLSPKVELVREKIRKKFPTKSQIIKEPYEKTLLLKMECTEGVRHIVSAALHDIDGVPMHILSIQTLALRNSTEESTLAQFFAEIKRKDEAGVVYIPSIDEFYNFLSPTSRLILIQELRELIFSPILIIGTAKEDMEDDFQFSSDIIELGPIETKFLMEFLKEALKNGLKYRVPVTKTEEILPLAPHIIHEPSDEQLVNIERNENRILRELRIFLRDMIFKLARNKKFVEFTKPVDTTEVPDYLEIISNPMDLETMMLKVNNGDYNSAKEFLDDINLIVSNALNYNPATSDTDRRIRHRAYELKDFAQALIEAEMDTDFEDTCQEIIRNRKSRKNKVIGSGEVELSSSKTQTPKRENNTENGVELTNRPLRNSTRKGRPFGSKGGKRKRNRLNKSNGSVASSVKSDADSTLNSTVNFISEPDSTPKLNGFHENSNDSLYDVQRSKKIRAHSRSISKSPDFFIKTATPLPDENGFVTCPESKKYILKVNEICNEFLPSFATLQISELLKIRFIILGIVESFEFNMEKDEMFDKIIEAIRNFFE